MAEESQAEAPDNHRKVSRERLERLIFQIAPMRRYTQDSPILPDVWFAFGEHPEGRVDLLLTPNRDKSPGVLANKLRDLLKAERAKEADPKPGSWELAYSGSTVAVKCTFTELVRAVLPLASWQANKALADWLRIADEDRAEASRRLVEQLQELDSSGAQLGRMAGVIWAARLIGTIELARQNRLWPEPPQGDPPPLTEERAQLLADVVVDLLLGAEKPLPDADSLIFSISRNRKAESTVSRSVSTVKADAARRLFVISCSDLKWAVLDSGIDATHPAFRTRDPKDNKPYAKPFEDARGRPANRTRVVATYDFTRIRKLLDPDTMAGMVKAAPAKGKKATGQLSSPLPTVHDLERHLKSGRNVDWDLFAPFLMVPHTTAGYRPPTHEHGTHVAGILAADWRAGEYGGGDEDTDEDLTGVCPDLEVYDIRVLDDQGRGDEFSVISALQFIRHLNANKDHVVVHGVNLSLSIPHDVANYACGRTPVCEECERVVGSGVVVVTAAGNEGYIQYATTAGLSVETYRNISITDPGNAQSVITVGATHRYRPHTYGVSYFSSRGPTGDGRVKPDLVAPGEKITASVPDRGIRTLDGTSMAAPHVSGSAALLMARHRELIGQPERVKSILCETATDLGRERYFQGSGMVDVLRAIQAV
ncbi:MAG TPA: S8 family peptidase [Actinomycetota bacterium]|nr:S8 family peptidase [Actinomycetota bacterium]